MALPSVFAEAVDLKFQVQGTRRETILMLTWMETTNSKPQRALTDLCAADVMALPAVFADQGTRLETILIVGRPYQPGWRLLIVKNNEPLKSKDSSVAVDRAAFGEGPKIVTLLAQLARLGVIRAYIHTYIPT